MKIRNNKFIYLISPNIITDKIFFRNLNLVLKSKKVEFFQLRLKKENIKKKLIIAKKIMKICKKNKVKFIVNDDPYFASKVNADGCHLGQKDMNVIEAKKILKNKIVGVTCHNSIKLAKKASLSGANYIALGAFFKTVTVLLNFDYKNYFFLISFITLYPLFYLESHLSLTFGAVLQTFIFLYIYIFIFKKILLIMKRSL